MLTLDEAIKHCEEKAEEIRKANEEMPTECKLSEDLCECAREHEQLAGWLKDYKRLLEEEQTRKSMTQLPDGTIYSPKLYQGCLSCEAHERCVDAFCNNAIHCGAYGKEADK